MREYRPTAAIIGEGSETNMKEIHPAIIFTHFGDVRFLFHVLISALRPAHGRRLGQQIDNIDEAIGFVDTV